MAKQRMNQAFQIALNMVRMTFRAAKLPINARRRSMAYRGRPGAWFT
jgi:hypothetical protein